jgi:hypothetical protein
MAQVAVAVAGWATWRMLIGQKKAKKRRKILGEFMHMCLGFWVSLFQC